MTESVKYDLFISYAEADEAWVEGYLLDSLNQADIRYHWEAAFTLGVPRLKEFENAIENSDRTLLIISPAYLVDNFSEFVELLGQSYGLETATWPVIPLILYPVELPLRLKMLTHLDATDETKWRKAIERLCAALKLPVSPVPQKPDCPYPGMIPFDESNSDRFFGREQEVEDLLDHLYRHQFITVIGSSGSGKSSLIFAGLLPKLRQSKRFGSGEWLVHRMRPGEHPLTTLKLSLGREQTEPFLTVTEAFNTQPTAQRVLLIIDQYEELFTIFQAEKQEFQQALLELLPIHNCYLILTVRADFYGDLMQSLLWGYIQLHRLEVLPLNETGLQKAILKPADKVGVFIESALVERLVKEAIGEPGVLPLIQETLVLLWEKLERRFLPLKAYEILVISRKNYETLGNKKLTGLQVAIARHANAALIDLKLKNQEQEAIARRIFLRLIQFGEGRADTRRQQPVNALLAGNDPYLFEKTLSHLVNCRLLTLSGGEDSTRKVDIAHEALISGWPTLQQWLTERREAERTRRRLEAKAQEWERLGKARGGLLDEVQLAEAQGWIKSPDAEMLGISPNIFALIQSSEQAIQRELHQQKKINRILIILIIGLSGLFLFALNQTKNANIKAIESLSASSKTQFTSGEQLEALISSISAGELLKKWSLFTPQPIKLQVLETLQQTVYGHREINRLQGHTNWIWGVSFNQDGTLLASASHDQSVNIWSIKGEKIRTLLHDDVVNDVSFSPVANIIASTSDDKKIRLWDTNGELIKVFSSLKLAATGINFSPDGQKIAAGSKEGIFLYDLEGKQLHFFANTENWWMSPRFSPDSNLILCPGKNNTVEIRSLNGKLISLLKGHQDIIYITNFSNDGEKLATASADTEVKIWNRNGSLLNTLFPQEPVTQVIFSKGDKILISGTRAGRISLWDVNSGQLIQTWKAHLDTVTDIKVSPDGKTIASTGKDNLVKLWNIQGNYIGRHEQEIKSVSFSPDGNKVVSGGVDNTIKVWDLQGNLIQNFTGHTDTIWSVKFSPDGQKIVSASNDKTAKIWDINENSNQTLSGHQYGVTTAKYSPNGQFVATASIDEFVKIWQPDGKLLNSFKAHDDIVTRLSFSPDSQMIATASHDHTIKIWTLNGTLIKAFQGKGGGINDLSFSPDGQMIASANDDNTVKLWNLDGKLLHNFIGHKGLVWTVNFSPDGKMIASGSGDNDNTIKIWNLKGKELATFQGNSYILSVNFSPDSKKIVSGDYNGVVALWNLNLDELLKQGCSKLHPYLNNLSNPANYKNLCKP